MEKNINMKKSFLFSSVILLLSLSVSSCSEDENESGKNILSKELSVSGVEGKFSYVDLGLGVKWATYNVGASQSTDDGFFFAWGETFSKNDYNCTTYKYCEGKKVDGELPKDFTKYCNNSNYGIVDYDLHLLAADDAATANWGDSWRMPTTEEFQDLLDFCTWEWTENLNGTGIAGSVGTSKVNGNTIFFPTAGARYKSNYIFVRERGYYWTRSLNGKLSNPGQAYCALFTNGDCEVNYTSRADGLCVRAVFE